MVHNKRIIDWCVIVTAGVTELSVGNGFAQRHERKQHLSKITLGFYFKLWDCGLTPMYKFSQMEIMAKALMSSTTSTLGVHMPHLIQPAPYCLFCVNE